MLSEEALIVLAGFGACGLLMLGVMELIWPTRPRHPVRLRRPGLARRPLPAQAARAQHRSGPLVRHGLEAGRAPYVRRGPASAPPAPRPVLPLPLTIPLPVIAAVAVAPVAAVPVASAQVSMAPEPVPLPVETPALLPDSLEVLELARVGSLVDECFALQQAGQHREVVELASAALYGGDPALEPGDAHTTAALWSVVALAYQGLGEDVEAGGALEAAVAAAPPADRATYQRQLATLADGVARRLLAAAAQHPRAESEECLQTIRRANAWLEQGLSAVSADPALVEASAAAQQTLWRACERAVLALLQRQEFRTARRLLREALDDPRFPTGRVDGFRELLTGTFGGEIGQLTAQAIRSVQDAREADALGALHRAESLLATLSDEALSPKRREEIDRRLWWVYSRLGERRVEAGDHEGALASLVHALGYDVGAEQHEETRALLERALNAAPDREAAIVHCDRLWARLRGASETLAGEPSGALI